MLRYFEIFGRDRLTNCWKRFPGTAPRITCCAIAVGATERNLLLLAQPVVAQQLMVRRDKVPSELAPA